MHGAGHVAQVGTSTSDYSASEAVWAFFSGLRAAPLTIGTDAGVTTIAVKRSGSKRTVVTTVSLKEPALISATLGATRTRWPARRTSALPAASLPSWCPVGDEGGHVPRHRLDRRHLRPEAQRQPTGSSPQSTEARAEETQAEASDAQGAVRRDAQHRGIYEP